MPRYGSDEEIMNAISELRDELALRGDLDAANDLTAALECFYTTASEALGELRTALQATRHAWNTQLSLRYRQLGDHATRKATRLLEMG